MGNFSINTKARAWIGTSQIANLKKAGLTEEQIENPEYVADFLKRTWEESGKGRTAATAVCISGENQLYHVHMALYGNSTTLGYVAKLMFDSHIEPQMGGKKALEDYLLKKPPYDEKGEQVLCTLGLENIRSNQGKRSDLEAIQELLDQGHTPNQIFMENIGYRRYEKLIKDAYLQKRMSEAGIIKDLHSEWHVGDTGTGKTHYYTRLCAEYGPENVYLMNDHKNGGLDLYIDQGAPAVLFIDDLKGGIPYEDLLSLLDVYTYKQTHSRYRNTYNLWTTCIITSIYPPEELYALLVDSDQRQRDSIGQLLRRLDSIVYHYKENGEYRSFSLPASEYINYADLKRKATADKDGFTKPEPGEAIPFETTQTDKDDSAGQPPQV